MPEISRFYGITIYMFYNTHNPPHIHVQYKQYSAIIEINSLKIKGKFTRGALNLVTEWISLHKEELIENWELSGKRIHFKKLNH